MTQVCTFRDGCKQGIDQQIFIGNRFHVKLRILSPESQRKDHFSHEMQERKNPAPIQQQKKRRL